MIHSALMVLLLACSGGGFEDPSREYAEPLPEGEKQADVVHKPDAMAVWTAPLRDETGEPVNPDLPRAAACDTCHGPTPENFAADLPSDEVFHTNIQIQHGDLGCNRCHDKDRTLLRLSDGSTFDFSEVMTLCGQCHGPIARDFRHGVHGGAEGYWDTRQGPRVRNNCIDCHAPHAPAIAPVMSAFPVRDRFYDGSSHGH